jgi:uncharacterized protein
MIFKAHHDKIKYLTIFDDRLPEEFDDYRLFYISDIHRRRVKSSTLDSIKNRIDSVVIGGDLTERYVPKERTRRNLQLLMKWEKPAFFVWGNNDYEITSYNLKTLLEDENVEILANKCKNIKKGNAVLSILGLDCSTYAEVKMDLTLGEMEGNYSILLSHIPIHYSKLTNEEKARLNIVLSAHTHGGQIRLCGLGPYESGAFEKYGNTSILISEGYGYSLLPLRLGTNAECHVITLKRKRG